MSAEVALRTQKHHRWDQLTFGGLNLHSISRCSKRSFQSPEDKAGTNSLQPILFHSPSNHYLKPLLFSKSQGLPIAKRTTQRQAHHRWDQGDLSAGTNNLQPTLVTEAGVSQSLPRATRYAVPSRTQPSTLTLMSLNYF